METVLRCGLTSLLFVIFALPSSVNAGDDHWIKIGSSVTGESSSYVDTSSVLSTGPGAVAAWVKSVYASPRKEGFFSASYKTELRRVVYRCAEPAVALTQTIRQDENQNVVQQERWPEAQWRFDSLPSGSIAHLEARVICGLAQLPTSRVSTSDTGDWRQLFSGNDTVGVDRSFALGRDGYFAARTRHYLKDAQTINRVPYAMAINYWVVLCKKQGIGMYAFVNRNLAGEVVETLAVPPETVKFWKPGDAEPAPVSEALFNILCKPENQSAAPTNPSPAPSNPVAVPPTAKASIPDAATSPKKEESSVSSGTGFYVSREGHILTNSHIVASCKQIVVRHPDRTLEAAQKVAEDSTNDLALLRVDRRPVTVATFRQTPAEPGESVMAIGFPLSGLLASEAIVSTGSVSATAGMGDNVTLIQVSTPVQPGNSGGPLLEKSGSVLGVVVSKLNALNIAKIIGDIPQNVNFAIKGEIARVFLDAYGIKYATTAPSKPIDTTAIASRGKAFTVYVVCIQ